MTSMTEELEKEPIDTKHEDTSDVGLRDEGSDTGKVDVTPSSVAVVGLGTGVEKVDDSTIAKPRKKRSRKKKEPRTESGDMLTDLATPKVFAGPEVKVQNELVRKLEKAIPLLEEKRALLREKVTKKLAKLDKDYGINDNKMLGKEEWAEYSAKYDAVRKELPPDPDPDPAILYLGSIVLTHVPKDPKLDEKMMKKARLVRTDNALKPVEDGTQLVGLAGAEKLVVRNTLGTMKAAGQLDYLRTSGFVGERWRVVVEVHYYRRRNKQQANLHKDTLGQTMFVNLNYTNDQPIPGPEFIVNPPLHKTHERAIEQNLPPEFMSDLKQTRDNLPPPKLIETKIVPPHGVVSFVDEAIHHATPLLGHREVRLDAVRTFLAQDPDFSGLYAKALHAFRTATTKPTGEFELLEEPKSFAELFDVELDPTEKERWRALMELCSGSDDFKVNRPTLVHLGMTHGQVDRLLSTTGPDTFNSVNIPQRARDDGTMGRLKMTEKKDRPVQLSRRMSMLALDDQVPVDPGGERRFFRTWVRAVRTED